jgi:hexosaminidase
MAPTSFTYLDYYQADPNIEPLAIGGYVPLEKVYSYDPIPDELNPEEAKHVLGAQGQLWSEYLPNVKHLEYMAWPRLVALSEIAWSPKAGKDYADFLTRLPADLDRLKAADVNYRPLTPEFTDVIGKWSPTSVGETFAPVEWNVTRQIAQPGKYSLAFSFTGGTCRLDIQAAELAEDGRVVARDEHVGVTGSLNTANTYSFDVPSLKPGTQYVVRAWIRSDGGHDSNGVVRLSVVK